MRLRKSFPITFEYIIPTNVIAIQNFKGESFLSLLPVLMLLNCDFPSRRPKTETSCDSVNN